MPKRATPKSAAQNLIISNVTRPTSDVIDDNDFLNRVRKDVAAYEELLVAKHGGAPLPDDVVEELARQNAIANPILEQYHLLHEMTPTLAMARATRQDELDFIEDIFVGMDLDNLDDDAEVPPEFVCPNCRYSWSGDPNGQIDQGQRVFMPTGRINPKTGKLQLRIMGAPLAAARGVRAKKNNAA